MPTMIRSSARFRRFCWPLAIAILAACAEPPATEIPVPQRSPVTLDDTIARIAGQTVYVPAYSHIYTWEQNRPMNVTTTLSIRNTDLEHPIIIAAVNYYDTDGRLIRAYLEQPIQLEALSSSEFVVDQDDVSGGSGASFIVEWVAQEQVSEPVIEAIMINAGGNQGVSFVSPGRVIKTLEEMEE